MLHYFSVHLPQLYNCVEVKANLTQTLPWCSKAFLDADKNYAYDNS